MSKKKDNIINFPKGKPIKVDNTAGIAREHILFTEDLTQGLVVNMIHNMSENGIDVDHPDFLRDTAFLVELIRSMIFREGGLDHPLQNFTKLFIDYTEEDGIRTMDIDLDMIKGVSDELFGDDDPTMWDDDPDDTAS